MPRPRLAAIAVAVASCRPPAGPFRRPRRAGLLWATAVAADLAAGLPARPRFAIGGEPTVEGREALDQLLTDVGWDPAEPPRPDDART